MKVFNILTKTLAIAAIALVTGCEKNPETSLSGLETQLCGEWKLVSPAETNVYMAFAEDHIFEEYQKLDDSSFELRRGTWKLVDNILEGQYNDGESWSSSYTILIADKTLTMTSGNEDALEYVYVRNEIPEIIKENCEIVVKSGAL